MHRHEATIENMFGGNNIIARNLDKAMVYHHPRNGNGTSSTLTPGSWVTEFTIAANASTATWIAPASTEVRKFYQVVQP